MASEMKMHGSSTDGNNIYFDWSSGSKLQLTWVFRTNINGKTYYILQLDHNFQDLKQGTIWVARFDGNVDTLNGDYYFGVSDSIQDQVFQKFQDYQDHQKDSPKPKRPDPKPHNQNHRKPKYEETGDENETAFSMKHRSLGRSTIPGLKTASDTFYILSWIWGAYLMVSWLLSIIGFCMFFNSDTELGTRLMAVANASPLGWLIAQARVIAENSPEGGYVPGEGAELNGFGTLLAFIYYLAFFGLGLLSIIVGVMGYRKKGKGGDEYNTIHSTSMLIGFLSGNYCLLLAGYLNHLYVISENKILPEETK